MADTKLREIYREAALLEMPETSEVICCGGCKSPRFEEVLLGGQTVLVCLDCRLLTLP